MPVLATMAARPARPVIVTAIRTANGDVSHGPMIKLIDGLGKKVAVVRRCWPSAEPKVARGAVHCAGVDHPPSRKWHAAPFTELSGRPLLAVQPDKCLTDIFTCNAVVFCGDVDRKTAEIARFVSACRALSTLGRSTLGRGSFCALSALSTLGRSTLGRGSFCSSSYGHVGQRSMTPNDAAVSV
jgi:hypothetical protein